MTKIPKEKDVMKGLNMLMKIDTARPYSEVAKEWNKYVRFTRKYDSVVYFDIVEKFLKNDEELERDVNHKLEMIETTLIVGQYVREA